MTREFKIGIASGLVGTALFALFIGPILSWSSKIILSVGSKVYSSYIDRLYEIASLGAPEDSAFFLLYMLLMMMTGFFAGSYAVLVRARWKIKHKEKQKPKPFLEFLSIKRLTIYAIIIVFAYLWVVVMFWGSWFNIRVTTSWKQHMLIVAPYLTDQEEKQLWSGWARMKSKADYDRLYEKLTGVASKNHVTLPENPAYTFKKF